MVMPPLDIRITHNIKSDPQHWQDQVMAMLAEPAPLAHCKERFVNLHLKKN